MSKDKIYNIAFLSTFPPRGCGIATFTEDLVHSLDTVNFINTQVIAITNSLHQEYSSKVTYCIDQHQQQDYLALANKLNHSDIDLLVIEHEYGIFGGDHGDYILDLVNNLEVPVITTLHTILTQPNEKQKRILKSLIEKSIKVVTMAKNAQTLLHTIYDAPLHKIEMLHHGVPYREIHPRQELKKEFGYEQKELISTFGLLGPGKGIEYAIEAMAKVVDKNPNALYLILGRSHPDQAGETYRNKLESLVKELNLENNVVFVNKFLSIDELIRYIQMSDIYLTPYLSKDQAVSGTLAYAVGYGKAIVSTPYLYAKEMLDENRGLLAEFESSDSLVKSLNYILQNPKEKLKMEENTLALGKTMYWHIVAQRYAEIFIDTIESNGESR